MKWTHSVLLVLLSLALSAPGFAQWSKRLDPAVPSTRDGKLDLAARPPKTRDGNVDLSGVWRPLPDPLGKPQNVENAIVPPRMGNSVRLRDASRRACRPPPRFRFRGRSSKRLR